MQKASDANETACQIEDYKKHENDKNSNENDKNRNTQEALDANETACQMECYEKMTMIRTMRIVTFKKYQTPMKQHV